jgi:ribonuclease P protein component
MRARTEFAAAVRGGVRAASPAVVVHLDPSVPGGTAPHVGFIVTRSVGTAVVRNTVRRRLRHLVRARLDRLPNGARVVLRVNPAAAGRTSAQLAVDLDRALERAVRQAARS